MTNGLKNRKEVFIYVEKAILIEFNDLHDGRSVNCLSFDGKRSYNCKLSITVDLYHNQSIHGNGRLYEYTGN